MQPPGLCLEGTPGDAPLPWTSRMFMVRQALQSFRVLAVLCAAAGGRPLESTCHPASCPAGTAASRP